MALNIDATCHISPPKMETPSCILLERKRYNIACSAIYIDIGYKSALVMPASDKKIRKIRRLL